jgi:proteasome accessory factor B
MPRHSLPKTLCDAFKELTVQLDSKERYSLENLGLALSFRPFAPEDSDPTAFQVITRALHEKRALKFDYRNLGAKHWQSRRVRPYHLACIDNHWYLFGYDVNRGAIRTFALTRLAQPTITGERFVRPKGFDPDKYLEGSFTVMKGDTEQEVVIEFDAWATDLVRGPPLAFQPGVDLSLAWPLPPDHAPQQPRRNRALDP